MDNSFINLFKLNPRLVNFSENAFTKHRRSFGNCLKGCKWSPDGTCIGTNSDDHHIRIFNLPQRLYNNENSELQPEEIIADLEFRESQIIYDFCWYPLMNSADYTTCFLLCTSKDVPIHLWDAYSGKISASYYAVNNVDELVSARSVQFSTSGSRIIAGYEKFICLFDLSVPGQNGNYIYDVPNGIVSCVASSDKLFASGSFNKLIGLYDNNSLENIAILQGHKGGITHLLLSNDGCRLYSGARKDNEILCWDLRNYGSILHTINRNCSTNQRIYFDIDYEKKILVTGDGGLVSIYDLDSTPNDEKVLNCINKFKSNNNCVNGVSIHPSMALIAATSGQRYLLDFNESEDDIIFDYKKSYIEDNNMKFWLFG